MKRFTLFLFILLGFFGLEAQEVGNNYFFKSTLSHTVSKKILRLNENDPIPSDVNINQKARFKVSRVSGDTIYFTYLNYPSSSDKFRIYNSDSIGIRTFSIDKKNFETLTSPYYNRWRGWNYGAYTIPARLRWVNDDFEFDANLSLGANVSTRVGFNREKKFTYVDVILGVSITKVNLNPDNSILGDTTIVDNVFRDVTSLSPTAFTTSLGLLFTFTEKINFGIYSGIDLISSSDQKAKWIYNRRPWLGIGINIIVGDANKSNKNQDQPE